VRVFATMFAPSTSAQWHELAELYAELARQLRDPIYADAA
jgi:hypothetical protein